MHALELENLRRQHINVLKYNLKKLHGVIPKNEFYSLVVEDMRIAAVEVGIWKGESKSAAAQEIGAAYATICKYQDLGDAMK